MNYTYQLLITLLLGFQITFAMHHPTPPKPSIFKVRDLAYSMIEPDTLFQERSFLYRYTWNALESVIFNLDKSIIERIGDAIFSLNPITFISAYMLDKIVNNKDE